MNFIFLKQKKDMTTCFNKLNMKNEKSNHESRHKFMPLQIFDDLCSSIVECLYVCIYVWMDVGTLNI